MLVGVQVGNKVIDGRGVVDGVVEGVRGAAVAEGEISGAGVQPDRMIKQVKNSRKQMLLRIGFIAACQQSRSSSCKTAAGG